jgi:ferrous iron transport protein A
MHMGVIAGGLVECVHRAPAGDPTVYRIDGMEIALRRETARQIEIEMDEAA